MVRAVFVDVDDTLLDFHACARESALYAAAHAGISLPDDFMDTFMRFNNLYWHRIEQGIMTREELHQVRWKSILHALGLEGDSLQMERGFREQLRNAAVPVPGAHAMLAFLSERVPVWVASNANRDQQEQRLRKAGMLDYVRGILASGNIGASKPDSSFFKACLDRVAPLAPRECLMIGDSMQADIVGAAHVGMLTCWYHSDGAEEEAGGIAPDWTIRKLEEITKISALTALERKQADHESDPKRMA